MADKSMSGMSGMGSMPGMNMGGPNQAANNTDPTKDQKGMDTGAPPVQAPGRTMMREDMKNMPMATPKSVWTVTGTEDWSMLRGFGKASGMVAMMNEMMVGGSPMGQMKMGKMDMSMADLPAPTPEEARVASDTTPAPAASEGATSTDQVTMTVSPNPPQVGDNTVNITVMGTDGKPATGLKLTATVAMTTMDMGTTHPPVMDMGNGRYMTKASFGMGGPWRVSLSGGGINQSMIFQAGATASQPNEAPAQPQATPAQSASARPMAAGPLAVKAAISPNPPSVGDDNLLTVTVTDAMGMPVTGATVTSTVTMVTMDMGTTHPAFKDIGGGKYQGKVGFGMGGPWKVAVHVAAPGQKPLVKAFVFNAK